MPLNINRIEPETLADANVVQENFQVVKDFVDILETDLNIAEASLATLQTSVNDINANVIKDLSYSSLDYLIFNDKNKLAIRAGTRIRLQLSSSDIRYLDVKTDLVINVNQILDTGVSSLQQGKNYYLYLVPASTDASEVIPDADTLINGLEFKLSLNATYPTGYTAADSKKLGCFHTLCANVGTIAGHTLTGYSAGDILPCSVWCLTHRPISNPEGMVFIKEIDKWVDIYLQSGTGASTASDYGATVTSTRPWTDHADDLSQVSKRLPTDAEFTRLAEGSNQKTAIYGSASPTPKTSGGHVDTSSRRMISNYGIEECCGFVHQWINNPSANGGTGWTNHDALAGAKGQLYGSSLALLAGGDWSNAASCGSRCRGAADGRANAHASIGGRGVSSPKRN